MTDNTMREGKLWAFLHDSIHEAYKKLSTTGTSSEYHALLDSIAAKVADDVDARFLQVAQSVPVVGEVVAWRWRYAQKSEEALATACFGKPQRESDKVFDGIPSDEAIQRALLKGVVPEYLYRKSTHSITAAELERLRKDAERYRWLRDGNDNKKSAACHIAVNCYGLEWDDAIDAAIAQSKGE